MKVSAAGLLVFCGIAMLACATIAQPIDDIAPMRVDTTYTHGHNGKPGCQTEQEVNRAWRNNVDPTRFWFCEELNADAIEIPCPINGGYMNGICVPWFMWEWTPPIDPPTMA